MNFNVNFEIRSQVETLCLGDGFESASLAVDYLKDRVEGINFVNRALSLVMGEGGFYLEFQDAPGSFFGALRPVTAEVVEDAEALEFLWEAISLYRAREGQVFVIYGPAYREDETALFFGTDVGGVPVERGAPRLELPLFFRADVRTKESTTLLGTHSGTVLFIRAESGENILLRLPDDVPLVQIGEGLSA